MENIHAIELKNITKTFGKVVANKNVDLYVDKGVVMSLLGENGSGKTTLMNMLSGIYLPDEGEILIDGKVANIRSPKDAYSYHIGMIHQHFKLVDVFSAAENIVLGLNEKGRLDHKAIVNKVKELADKYGFDTYVKERLHNMLQSTKPGEMFEELLIGNYDLCKQAETNSNYLLEQFRQLTLFDFQYDY